MVALIILIAIGAWIQFQEDLGIALVAIAETILRAID